MTTTERTYTELEALKILGLTKQKIHKLITERKLQATPSEHGFVFAQASLDEFRERRSLVTSPIGEHLKIDSIFSLPIEQIRALKDWWEMWEAEHEFEDEEAE